MPYVEANISMSLDGYITGPNLKRYPGLGKGGDILHAWLETEKRPMDLAIGEERQIAGAVITSRTVYEDTNGWGDDGFYHMPVFVVTHRKHNKVVKGKTTFSFITSGVPSAIARAAKVAGDKRVHIMGGATIIQQALAAGLVDELFLHVAPVILGGGTKLFARLPQVELEQTEVIESDNVSHLRYRVLK